MNALSGIDMNEVTRLTRAGQLAEATALLQSGLAGPTPDRWRREQQRASTMVPRLTIHRETLTQKGFTDAPNAPFRYTPSADHGPVVDQARSPLPDGARFETHRFSNAAGSRRFKLYVPSSYRGAPVPLVVMLHGCTQSPDDFAAGTRMNLLAEEGPCLVVYPEQTKAANSSKCWNWFNTAEQQRDQGEPSLIAGLTRQTMRDYAVGSDRVFVAGLSAGGAAAAIMASCYPDLYSGACIHSGLACGAAKDVPSAFAAMRNGGATRTDTRRSGAIPTIVFHGAADKTVHPVNADRIVAQFTAVPVASETIEHGRSAGGRNYTKTVRRDAAGRSILERWDILGAGHAWSGGSPDGSYTDPRGPDASREMMRFFLESKRP